ncbi:MAG: hypothetical protein GY833_22815 [Aestuariibacter sp.]|nr:hypothetical protein [Aestuariibacter sp.]
MSESKYIQHYTLEANKESQRIVREASQAKTLTLNTNISYLAGKGDGNLGFNNNTEITSTLGYGRLLAYDAAGQLLMTPRVSVSIQNGHVGRDSDPAVTPHTLRYFGRLRGLGAGKFSQPYLDMNVGSASGAGGFVLSAPKLTLVIDVIPDPAGVLDSGEVIYHSTLVGSGEVDKVYVLIDEDPLQQRLPNAPDPQLLATATPEQIKEGDASLDVRWLQLPVGTLGDDVVQLSESNLQNESRLIIQDAIRVVMPVMTPESETELMNAMTALATERGYNIVSHS